MVSKTDFWNMFARPVRQSLLSRVDFYDIWRCFFKQLVLSPFWLALSTDLSNFNILNCEITLTYFSVDIDGCEDFGIEDGTIDECLLLLHKILLLILLLWLLMLLLLKFNLAAAVVSIFLLLFFIKSLLLLHSLTSFVGNNGLLGVGHEVGGVNGFDKFGLTPICGAVDDEKVFPLCNLLGCMFSEYLVGDGLFIDEIDFFMVVGILVDAHSLSDDSFVLENF